MIDRDAENDVLLAFCHNGSVMTVFMNSCLAAFAEDARRASHGKQRRLVEYHDAPGPYIHDNRARVAKYFLDHTDFQWLWFLDNDIKFPPDSLYRLLDAAEEHECYILGAAYWNQYGSKPPYLTWLAFSTEGIRALAALPENPYPLGVTAVGMGCTLIHRDALEAVRTFQRENYKDDPWDTFGSDVLRFDDGTAHRMGEDVTFCVRARRHGFETYGLPTLLVEHFKPIFAPHGKTAWADALHDPLDAGGEVHGASNGHEVKPIPAP